MSGSDLATLQHQRCQAQLLSWAGRHLRSITSRLHSECPNAIPKTRSFGRMFDRLGGPARFELQLVVIRLCVQVGSCCRPWEHSPGTAPHCPAGAHPDMTHKLNARCMLGAWCMLCAPDYDLVVEGIGGPECHTWMVRSLHGVFPRTVLRVYFIRTSNFIEAHIVILRRRANR